MLDSRSIFYICSFTLLSLPLSAIPILYGDDNRIEPFEVSQKSSLKGKLDSVALLLESDKVKENPLPRYKKIETTLFKDTMDLCPGERFSEQPTVGFCTAFLITEDLLLTAGHCLETESTCEEISILFDYREKEIINLQSSSIRVLKTKLFKCKEILYRAQPTEDEPNRDIALLRLDRKTKGRLPLSLADHEKLSQRSLLSVVGYPFGLPLKIAESGEILDNNPEEFFSAAVDTYSGNSGSPVFNQENGKVEGILIRGHEDFTWKGHCYASTKCLPHECSGEDILRSHIIKKEISPLLGGFL